MKSLPRALLALAGGKSRGPSSAREHAPDRYVAALAPPGSVTEMGDRP